MSTNVFWAGTRNNRGVASIYTNPAGQFGSLQPLDTPLNFLDRILFHSSLDYLNIVFASEFVKSFGFVNINQQATGKKGKSSSEIPVEGSTLTTVLNHNLGYVPGGILVDTDNLEAISGNSFVQNIDNNSFRIIYLLADSTSFYLKEKWFVRRIALPAITKKYYIAAFNNPVTV